MRGSATLRMSKPYLVSAGCLTAYLRVALCPPPVSR